MRGGLLKGVNEPFFIPPNESVFAKTQHRKPRSKQKYARYKLIETGERRRPGAFYCDHFYTFSLLVVVVDVFLCSS